MGGGLGNLRATVAPKKRKRDDWIKPGLNNYWVLNAETKAQVRKAEMASIMAAAAAAGSSLPSGGTLGMGMGFDNSSSSSSSAGADGSAAEGGKKAALDPWQEAARTGFVGGYSARFEDRYRPHDAESSRREDGSGRDFPEDWGGQQGGRQAAPAASPTAAAAGGATMQVEGSLGGNLASSAPAGAAIDAESLLASALGIAAAASSSATTIVAPSSSGTVEDAHASEAERGLHRQNRGRSRSRSGGRSKELGLTAGSEPPARDRN